MLSKLEIYLSCFPNAISQQDFIKKFKPYLMGELSKDSGKDTRRLVVTLNTYNMLNIYNFLKEADIENEMGEYIDKSLNSYYLSSSLKYLEDIEGDQILRNYQRVDVATLTYLYNQGVDGLIDRSDPRTGKTPKCYKFIDELPLKKILFVGVSSDKFKKELDLKQFINKDATVINGDANKRQKLYENYNEGWMITSPRSITLDLVSYEKKIEKIEKEYIEITKQRISEYSGEDKIKKINEINGQMRAEKKKAISKVEDTFKVLKLIDFDVIIIDEAHFLRNSTTLQTKTIKKYFKSTKLKYAMSGTLASNKNNDVFGVLQFLYPDIFTNKTSFEHRFFNVDIQRGAGGRKFEVVGELKKSMYDEFHEIVDSISVKRIQAEALPWVGEMIKEIIPVEMSDKQLKYYNDMREQFEVDSEDLQVFAPNVLTQLTRLQQISNHPSIINNDENAKKIKSGKLDYILEWLENNPDEKVIIISRFTTYLEFLHEKLIDKYQDKVVLLKGDKTERQHEIIDQFQNGNKQIMLAQIKVIQTGHTLDNCNTIIFADISYTPDENLQASQRITDTVDKGENKQIKQVIYLQNKNSIDEVVYQIQKNKQGIVDYVNNNKDYILDKISNGTVKS